MSNIPTAEEFICNEYETTIEKVVAEPEHIKWMMIEFAKLHVQAALKAAADFNPDSTLSEKTEHILGAYPIKLIK